MLGKKQLSQLTFFNYVTGITIGSIAADIAGETETPFFNVLVSKARILLDGEPSIVIKKGKIVMESLKRSRLNIDDLSMMLREKNVFSTQDVQFAILEPDGKLSVLMAESQQSVRLKKSFMQRYRKTGPYL